MDIFEAQITAAESGTRLDTYLAAILDGISRSYIQKLISEQYILINSRPVKANYKIKTADQRSNKSVTVPRKKRSIKFPRAPLITSPRLKAVSDFF